MCTAFLVQNNKPFDIKQYNVSVPGRIFSISVYFLQGSKIFFCYSTTLLVTTWINAPQSSSAEKAAGVRTKDLRKLRIKDGRK